MWELSFYITHYACENELDVSKYEIKPEWCRKLFAMYEERMEFGISWIAKIAKVCSDEIYKLCLEHRIKRIQDYCILLDECRELLLLSCKLNVYERNLLGLHI